MKSNECIEWEIKKRINNLEEKKMKTYRQLKRKVNIDKTNKWGDEKRKSLYIYNRLKKNLFEIKELL